MKLDELMGTILEILPNAYFDEQMGEIVIGTGLYVDENDTLHLIPEED